MIVGIGTDCCVVERIEDAIESHGDRFLHRLFTEAERSAGAFRPEPALYFARRFSAKEACAKALGTGIGGCARWCEIEVLNDVKGRPTINMKGGALQLLNRLVPSGYRPYLHLSLADDPPMALAFVIIEARTDS